MHLAAPTLLEHGSDDLKRTYLHPTVTGEISWCQLFSEPGAGSDLAGADHARRAASTASGSSTARRSGTPARTTPTSAC